MTNYQKGYRFEKRVQKHLEKMGFYVIRSSGSKGIFDLVCFFKNTEYKPLGIQCKTTRTFGHNDVITTTRHALRYNLIPILSYPHPKTRDIIFINLNSAKEIRLA